MPRYTETLSLSSGKFVRNADQDQRYVESGRLYIPRSLEGTESTGTSTRGRENSRERAQYRFNDSGSFSIPSTIRTVDYRQESESLSSLSPARRSSHPFLTLSLLCSFLVSWLLIEALSLSIIRDRVAGAPRLFLRLVERSPPPIRILSPSSSRRAPAVDIASIESDVEGALSGSSRRPEYQPSLSHLFSSTSSGNSRDDTDERESVERRYQTKFRVRAIFLPPDRFGTSNM